MAAVSASVDNMDKCPLLLTKWNCLAEGIFLAEVTLLNFAITPTGLEVCTC